jgi:aldehyde dehydrogenase (NAD+)
MTTQSTLPEWLADLGIKAHNPAACVGVDGWIDASEGRLIESINPTTEEAIATAGLADVSHYEQAVSAAQSRFASWKMVPAPVRGALVRDLGEELRANKDALGRLVSLEMGKILQEGLGEVQEMIDICDFAVGLSRQLYGLTMKSERPGHRMMEQWMPLGPVGIITAFNFPVAVWAWNAAIAAVCGNTMIWKPSPKTPLTALAVQEICNRVMARHDADGLFTLVIGDIDVGEAMSADTRIPLVSATGSTRMGKAVSTAVASRLGKSILELGGNNAIIIDKSARLDLAVRAIVFGAVGTAGQRCTTTRRLFVHRDVLPTLVDKLCRVYKQVAIGDPLEEGTLMGPLIDAGAVEAMQQAIAAAKEAGATVLCGGEVLERKGFFVTPCLIQADEQIPIMKEETFAPILYIVPFTELDEAIRLQNDVPQGLSSAMFTTDLIASETFLSALGSDCGIANINIGTSGAEIGGAFGGEKETGGGREAGSDAWKAYMRRQTCTINWSSSLPLAQGIHFGDDA